MGHGGVRIYYLLLGSVQSATVSKVFKSTMLILVMALGGKSFSVGMQLHIRDPHELGHLSFHLPTQSNSSGMPWTILVSTINMIYC